MGGLSIPLIGADADVLSAALAYAKAGWYVGPISHRHRKNPGSVLGKGWPAKTSRDPEQIVAWFAGTDHLVFLHVGRSGAWVADVDHPESVPEVLADAIRTQCPPHQSSRPNQPGRGHSVFLQPAERTIGNGVGTLGKAWGEGRGKNGIIVVAPSPHKDEADGARYEWLQTGVVPEMTPQLDAALPTASASADVPSDDKIEEYLQAFHDAHTECLRESWLKGPTKAFADAVTAGSSRHDALRDSLYWAARESLLGLYSAKASWDAHAEPFITAMAIARKPTERRLERAEALREAKAMWAWAIAHARLEGADALWRQERYRGVAEELRRDDGDGTPDDFTFWDTRTELTAIRDAARERLVSPWALLGAVLAHVVANTGPHVVLPPLVGSHGSLNLFVGMVGPSGVGKDSALGLARELLAPDEFPAPVSNHEVGTGQGIAAAYVTENKQTGGIPVQCCDAALFTITEIDDLAAHAAMGGANIIPTLRKIYSGADLGNQYADKTKRRTVKAHRYRCALVAGIQPARSRVLLSDAEGGLPQRWIWLPTNDPNYTAPEAEFATFWATGTLWTPARSHAPVGEVVVPPSVIRKTRIELEVCDTARDAVVEARRRRVTAPLTSSTGPIDLDGHSLFTRLKLAAALGLLARSDSTEVTEEDWTLAGRVMAVSDATREVCLTALGAVRRKENQARGRDEAEREDARDGEKVRQVARTVLRKLSADSWVTGSDLRRGVYAPNRPHLDEAIERLVAAGQVEREAIDGQGQRGMRYRRAETS